MRGDKGFDDLWRWALREMVVVVEEEGMTRVIVPRHLSYYSGAVYPVSPGMAWAISDGQDSCRRRKKACFHPMGSRDG